MQQSGGLLLPPVQKLVASLIFAPSGAKMQFESYIVLSSYPLFKTVNFTYGLPPVLNGLSHGLKSVRWTVARRRSRRRRLLDFIESYIVLFSYPLFKTVNFAYGLPYMDFSAATNAQLSG